MMTVLGIGAIALFMLLGVVGYLLMIASSRAEHTEARVRALLRQAETGQDPTGRKLLFSGGREPR